MSRSQQFEDGYRSAMKDCITWLSERAKSMSDPHATDVLNCAAFSLGCRVRDAKQGRLFKNFATSAPTPPPSNERQSG